MDMTYGWLAGGRGGGIYGSGWVGRTGSVARAYCVENVCTLPALPRAPLPLSHLPRHLSNVHSRSAPVGQHIGCRYGEWEGNAWGRQGGMDCCTCTDSYRVHLCSLASHFHRTSPRLSRGWGGMGDRGGPHTQTASCWEGDGVASTCISCRFVPYQLVILVVCLQLCSAANGMC